MKVRIAFYDCTAGKNYNYTQGGGLGIPSSLVTKNTAGNAELVTVWLNGNNDDYIFIDFDDDLEANTFDQPVAMDNKNKIYAVVIKCEEGVWTSHYDPDDDDCSHSLHPAFGSPLYT